MYVFKRTLGTAVFYVHVCMSAECAINGPYFCALEEEEEASSLPFVPDGDLAACSCGCPRVLRLLTQTLVKAVSVAVSFIGTTAKACQRG